MIPRALVRFAAFFFCCFAGVAAAEAKIVSYSTPHPAVGEIERLDAELSSLIPAGAKIEKLAEGFLWSEGPVWSEAEHALLFSDTRANTVYRWQEGKGVEVFLTPSGFKGEKFDGKEPGSNGLTFDRHGRLLLCQHGNRQVASLNEDGRTFTAMADHFRGKRFSSPNDLCVDQENRIYFTDPPYGLPNGVQPEIEFNGVYRIEANGQITLITRQLSRPNGIALSPDERTLYVANSDEHRPIVLAIDLHADGSWANDRVFFDGAELQKKGLRGSPDGMKVDRAGHVWTTGPGGILILDKSGRHLGSIHTHQPTANLAWGEDGSTLFITANNQLLRLRTSTQGILPGKH